MVSVNGQGTGWSAGWTVRVDSGLHSGAVLRSHDTPGNAVSLEGASTLTFDRNGRLAAGGTAQLSINDLTKSTTRRCVVVDLSGLPQARVGACS